MLRAFNFDGKFCEWVHTILVSAKLSFSVNGKLVGFFSSQRGIHQGDPLAPILFCLVEDALSIGISLLMSEGEIYPVSGPGEYRHRVMFYLSMI